MRILLSNDDGIDARGLAALYDALEPLGELWVVAPAAEQSAMSHSLTMHRPLRVRERSPRQYSVDGTPADTIYVALHHILPGPPDLVVSGINRGANLGFDVHYSGTVAAAREACLQGIPAIAVSAHIDDAPPRYDTAGMVARRVVEHVRAHGLDEGILLNVNVPCVAPKDLRGLKAAVLGRRMYASSVDLRHDPRGKPYVWIGGPHQGFEGPEHADGRGIDAGWATVTPLSVDPTDYRILEHTRDWTDA
jgi:5'-nucleotidase